ncbi:MAG: type II toxin-antitoxin system HigB family toxin [Dysgonamonadaceae bacterium]|jgi:mRNA interferase HigB|nr:type II toxin-antitoxin system HigB family toxin [Dysgonamonadaceae bacterium]
MQIFGKKEIEQFITRHAITKSAIENWIDIVEASEWKNHNDVKQAFPSADYVGNAKYVFNIKGNGFRIVTVVVFVAGTVTVRFIGTHEEYNKINCKTI